MKSRLWRLTFWASFFLTKHCTGISLGLSGLTVLAVLLSGYCSVDLLSPPDSMTLGFGLIFLPMLVGLGFGLLIRGLDSWVTRRLEQGREKPDQTVSEADSLDEELQLQEAALPYLNEDSEEDSWLMDHRFREYHARHRARR